MDRYLTPQLTRHFGEHRQMAFLSGPRQVGKTTIARQLCERLGTPDSYLNWDNLDHRALVLSGPERIVTHLGLDRLREAKAFCAFDELHKYRRWRDLLKGLFDQHENELSVLVTGSARLDVFKRGGDSLMGRYFPYTLHPVSVAEILAAEGTSGKVVDRADVLDRSEPIDRAPRGIDEDRWEALNRFGGFPEPFIKAEQRFWTRWRGLRTQQLLREDLRDLTRVQAIDQIEILAETLRHQIGQSTSYTSLSNHARVSVDTVRRWLAILQALHYCFAVRPWHRNVPRALRKEPKIYLRDWSLVDDTGARAENLVAAALLKACDGWTETGLGDFALHFLRDKEKREVDFLVCRDARPWFLVEVKSSGRAPLSHALAHFQRLTGAGHAFQVAMDLPFVERDCFETTRPTIVPARTLLAQLV